jgi:hypothetical protein
LTLLLPIPPIPPPFFFFCSLSGYQHDNIFIQLLVSSSYTDRSSDPSSIANSQARRVAEYPTLRSWSSPEPASVLIIASSLGQPPFCGLEPRWLAVPSRCRYSPARGPISPEQLYSAVPGRLSITLAASVLSLWFPSLTVPSFRQIVSSFI